MRGKLYGIGVGPGDPELLTLQAVRLIRSCDALAVPGKKKEETTAYQIVLEAVPEICNKECLALDMPRKGRGVSDLGRSLYLFYLYLYAPKGGSGWI